MLSLGLLDDEMEVPLSLSFFGCGEHGRAMETCGDSCTYMLFTYRFSISLWMFLDTTYCCLHLLCDAIGYPLFNKIWKYFARSVKEKRYIKLSKTIPLPSKVAYSIFFTVSVPYFPWMCMSWPIQL